VSNWPHFSSRLIFAIFAATKSSLSIDIVYTFKIYSLVFFVTITVVGCNPESHFKHEP
jgi:hypothetical protein